MSWSLTAPKTPASEPQVYQLRDDHATYIVADDLGSLRVVHELNPDVQTVLGRIVVGPWGAKLEAIAEPLHILSGPVHSKDPLKETYQLQPRAGKQSETLFLRPGDLVSSSKATTSLTCVWHPVSEIQVTSSAGDAPVKHDTSHLDHVADTPEEETEDEDINGTVLTVKATQSKSQQPHATPQLSNQRSLVIQETPTAARVNGMFKYPGNIEAETASDQSKLLEQITCSADQAEAEPYLTARTGQSQINEKVSTEQMDSLHDAVKSPEEATFETDDISAQGQAAHPKRNPKVVVQSMKRPSPAVDEVPSFDEKLRERSAKRAKRSAPSDSNMQDDQLSKTVVDTSPASAMTGKDRKRKSGVKNFVELTETTPSRSQRSSQHSYPAPTTEPYSGDTPCVATSNSSVTDKSQAVKFLKKQGGRLVESGKESFNVLCVRDGHLHKTSKLLQAIATGTPIVTDKWLTDSAKAGHFLSVDAYRPSAPKQEMEWNFKLEDVIGQPQTPFKGYTIHFTASAYALYKPFTEIEQVCKAAGANKVTKKKMDKSDKVIVLAVEEEDKEVERLMQDGITCYSRHLLSLSIIRGALDLDSDEFKIVATRTRRGRKA